MWKSGRSYVAEWLIGLLFLWILMRFHLNVHIPSFFHLLLVQVRTRSNESRLFERVSERVVVLLGLRFQNECLVGVAANYHRLRKQYKRTPLTSASVFFSWYKTSPRLRTFVTHSLVLVSKSSGVQYSRLRPEFDYTPSSCWLLCAREHVINTAAMPLYIHYDQLLWSTSILGLQK